MAILIKDSKILKIRHRHVTYFDTCQLSHCLKLEMIPNFPKTKEMLRKRFNVRKVSRDHNCIFLSTELHF